MLSRTVLLRTTLTLTIILHQLTYFPLLSLAQIYRSIGEKVSFHDNVVLSTSFGNKRSVLQFPLKCSYNKFGLPGVGKNTPRPKDKREQGKSRYSLYKGWALMWFNRYNTLTRNHVHQRLSWRLITLVSKSTCWRGNLESILKAMSELKNSHLLRNRQCPLTALIRRWTIRWP